MPCHPMLSQLNALGLSLGQSASKLKQYCLTDQVSFPSIQFTLTHEPYHFAPREKKNAKSGQYLGLDVPTWPFNHPLSPAHHTASHRNKNNKNTSRFGTRCIDAATHPSIPPFTLLSPEPSTTSHGTRNNKKWPTFGTKCTDATTHPSILPPIYSNWETILNKEWYKDILNCMYRRIHPSIHPSTHPSPAPGMHRTLARGKKKTTTTKVANIRYKMYRHRHRRGRRIMDDSLP